MTMHNSTLQESIALYRLTLFTAPEAPVNLQVTERTPHAIHLTWGHPNITNGKLRKFKVRVKLVSSQLRKKERKMEIPENGIEVKHASKVYSYEVSEFWNLNFLKRVSNIIYCFVYLLFCTFICIEIVMLQKM
jgi:hypothetical protein